MYLYYFSEFSGRDPVAAAKLCCICCYECSTSTQSVLNTKVTYHTSCYSSAHYDDVEC